MPRIVSYPRAYDLDPEQVFLVDKPEGDTKIITSNDLAKSLTTFTAADDYYAMLDRILSFPARKMVYRGKNLGTEVTNEQWEQIREGSFHDLFLGDYWVINNNNWRIMDFDYWFNVGDVKTTDHHVVIMPDKRVMMSSMQNEEGLTNLSYATSDFYTETLPSLTEQISELFGEEHLLHYRRYYQTYQNNNWNDSVIELPSCIMIFGFMSSVIQGIASSDRTMLSSIAVNSTLISSDYSYYLQDPFGSNRTNFMIVSGSGSISSSIPTENRGIRPVFGLIG